VKEEVEDVDGSERMAREKPADLLYQVGLGNKRGKTQKKGGGNQERVGWELHDL